MCIERIEPVAILAALATGTPLAVHRTSPACRTDAARAACLSCLSEALHDAGDLVEGAAERITPRVP